jgi:transketolase
MSTAQLHETTDIDLMARQVRRDIIRMVYQAQSGHPGGSLGCADFLTTLYGKILQRKPGFDMKGRGEDVFFLSNGHISPVWYSVLARSGYFPVEELSTFRRINSRLQGHPATHEHLPGIRVASGSLGQGLSVAIGAALAKKLDGDDRMVYVLTGDGELEEGQVWEAAMFAAHHKVDNLIAVVDYNGQQIDGPTEMVMGLGNLQAKWEAFGWGVHTMNGHDTRIIMDVMQRCKTHAFAGKPQVILMSTEMGYGVDFMKGSHHWHGVAPNKEQMEKALTQLEETPFGDF